MNNESLNCINSLISQNSLSGHKVLITGGLGFIGSNLAHKCLSLGAEVTVYDCLDPRSGGNIQNVADIKDKIKILINDVRNFEALCSAVIDKTILFNCAAYTSHPQSMKEPFVDIEVNCKGAINILEAARRFNPELKIVHIGTSTQNGKMLFSPITEEHPEFPIDIYSANKTASEKYMLVYAQAYNMPICVVRLANVFGPRSNIRSADFGFMNFFIGLGLSNKEITVFGEGKQLRNISYIDDATNALIMAALSEGANGKVFFAASDKQVSVSEIASTICEVIGGRIRSVEWPKDREAIEIGDAIISNQKIKSALGWKPTTSLRDGLKNTKEYFQPVLHKYLDIKQPKPLFQKIAVSTENSEKSLLIASNTQTKAEKETCQ